MECHGFHVLCRYLRPLTLDMRHILPGGELEMQPATERRLLARARTRALPLLEGIVEPASAQTLARAYDDWWCKA